MDNLFIASLVPDFVQITDEAAIAAFQVRQEAAGQGVGHQVEDVAEPKSTPLTPEGVDESGAAGDDARDERRASIELLGPLQRESGDQFLAPDLEEAAIPDRQRLPSPVRTVRIGAVRDSEAQQRGEGALAPLLLGVPRQRPGALVPIPAS